jgi:hypothetical protein
MSLMMCRSQGFSTEHALNRGCVRASKQAYRSRRTDLVREIRQFHVALHQEDDGLLQALELDLDRKTVVIVDLFLVPEVGNVVVQVLT